jgi:CheY-like chemotaxis protein
VAERPRAPSSGLSAAASGQGKRVLFVDDESVLVALGKSFLEILGYQPDAYQDPRAALAAFCREPHAFAALVTDLAMPGLSGFDLVRSLRTMRAELPVLMISGNLGPEERRTAAELGIQELALKPVSIKQLGELLERLCEAACAKRS